MASAKPVIGFVGLGAMGFGMATNLVKQGYTVKGYDVFPKSVERFKEAGGVPASTLAESAEGCPYYVCMVASAPQVQEVLFNEQTGIAKGESLSRVLYLLAKVFTNRNQPDSPPAWRHFPSLLHRPLDLCAIRREGPQGSWTGGYLLH
jgi:hypothetical protein